MPKLPPPVNRYIFHPMQAAAAIVAYSLMRVLPIDVASAIGGWLGRAFGPHLPVSARAVHNLTNAFPDKSPTEIAAIVRGMWDNLGRVAAEYPHLSKINVYDPNGRVEGVPECEHAPASKPKGDEAGQGASGVAKSSRHSLIPMAEAKKQQVLRRGIMQLFQGYIC